MDNKKITTWKNSYTWLLVMNTLYMIIFFIFMQLFY